MKKVLQRFRATFFIHGMNGTEWIASLRSNEYPISERRMYLAKALEQRSGEITELQFY